MIIQQEQKEDFQELYNFIQTAFKTAQVSDGTEQDFTNNLRSGPNYIPQLALTLKENNKIIGFIMLTKLFVDTPAGKYESLLLAPICIDINHRSLGLGQKLMAESFKRAVELGYKAVFLVGNPDYYKKAGFEETTKYNIENIDGMPAKFILAKELIPGALNGLSGKVSFH